MHGRHTATFCFSLSAAVGALTGAASASAQPAANPPLEGCALTKSRLAALPGLPAAEPAATGIDELLTDTDVQSYFLQMEILPATDSVAATCTLSAVSRTDGLTQMTIRLRSNFTISSVTCNGSPTTYSRPGGSTVEMLIDLDRAYNLGEAFELAISYSGQPAALGFGSFVFGFHGGAEIVSSLSEPYYCYTWWPAKEDNADKATIDMHLTVPAGNVAVSNGLLEGVDNLSGGRLRYRWSSGYPTAPYLVFLSATNYVKWTRSYAHAGGNMPVEFYIYPEDDSPSNRQAWERCLTMLPVFRDIFGEYPFVDEKYGIYEFEFGGGMEHQTLTGQGTFSEWVTAHELGHSWWGDMITCETWHDIWLNEGFATYSEALWEERKPGSSGLPALFAAMNNRRPSAVSDTVYVYDTGNINRIFDYNYSYLKAGWVLHMLRRVLDDAAFFAALADYRAAYQYDSATTEDFKNAVEVSAGRELDWFFTEWVYEGGAPAYAWNWQNATVNGRNYLLVYLRQTQLSSYGVFIMPVDVRVTTALGTTTHVVWNDALVENFVLPLDAPATTVSLDPDKWILWTSRTTATFVPGGPVIVDAAPLPGEVLPGGASQASVTFHANVSASAAHFSVVGDAGGPQPFSYAYNSSTNTATLTFGGALPADAYTVTVSDAVTAGGKQLDGEIADPMSAASLPSGDGVPGGSAVYRFVVQGAGLPGDFDGDGDVDLSDFTVFQLCFDGSSNPPAATCPPGVDADLDGDGDVDLADFLIFQQNFTGSL